MEKAVVEKVAALARLRLDESEASRLTRDMARILEHIEALETAPKGADIHIWGDAGRSGGLRPDAAAPSLSRETALMGASRRVDAFVEVPFPGDAT